MKFNLNILSTGRKYNPAFFQYIYWIVTFVKLNELGDQEIMLLLHTETHYLSNVFWTFFVV